MKLHHDREGFSEILEATANHFNLDPFQVEKDYFVSLLLREINKNYPNIIFKGGTSLSKCYDVINRFSEDIDLTVKFEDNLSKNQRAKEQEKLREIIYNCAENLEFVLLNMAEELPRSRREFNFYKFGFPKLTSNYQQEGVLDHILVETMITYEPFPFEELPVSNYITKFLNKIGETEIINQFELLPFQVKTQTIERTFIDKIFAICDYFLEGKSSRCSRHLYDIHMIYQYGDIQMHEILELFPIVASIRRNGHNTASSQYGFELAIKLKEIIFTQFYRDDYQKNTVQFLSKQVTYDEVIQSLNELIENNWIPEIIQEIELSSPTKTK